MHEMLQERIREALIDASVPETATFQEAVEVLQASTLSAIAVLGEGGNVVGLFGVKQLLHGLFPLYLEEIRHSAFILDDLPGLTEHVAEVSTEPVTGFMMEPLVVDIDSSATHIAEQLVHSDIRAIAVVREERFIGMIGALGFCWLVYRSLAPSSPEPSSSS